MSLPIRGAADAGLSLDFSGKSFLVIDDFDAMRGMLRDLLRGCGADAKSIDVASNGNAAIALLARRRYDGVLCDYNLGAGKNGQQVLEEAKVKRIVGPACAWIMVTAEKTSEAVSGAAEYQPDGYLIKPITEATLRSRMAKIWAKKNAVLEIDKALAEDDYEAALRLCDARLSTDRANRNELLRLRCQLLLKTGGIEEAQKAFESVLVERDAPWAKAGLAKIHYQKGDYTRACALLKEVTSENHAYVEAHDWLAKVLQASGDLEQAQEVLERAVKLSPNSVVRQKALGEVALERGKLDSAERAFRKSISVGQFSVLKTEDAYIGLAKTHGAKGDTEEALKTLASIGKEFDRPEAHLKAKTTEGLLHLQAGNPEKAREAAHELGRMLEQADANTDSKVTLQMAELMLAAGEKEKAVELLKQQVKNAPDDGALLDQVQAVFAKAQMGQEGTELIEHSRREAVEMMNHGALLTRQGKLEEALEWMRRAREAMPSNVRVLFNYAHVAILEMQRRGADPALANEIRACLREANRLSPGDRRFAELMARLRQR